MAVGGIEKIVIRHKGGSKANQVEDIAIGDKREFSIGRDLKSDIAYDQTRDDIVSRRHAVIKIAGDGSPTFRIEDLGSSNGTFLNGERISGESELVPEDVVQLGEKGPSFLFDVSPRPKSLQTRTRVISGADTNMTRVLSLSQDGKTAADATANLTGKSTVTDAKAGVGKNTVMMMLGQERRSTNRLWIATLSGVLLFLGIGGGALYWRQKLEADDLRLSHAREIDRVRTEGAEALSSQMGQGARDIVQRFGNATVQVDVQWRAYDAETGRPIYHKVVECKKKLYLAFVRHTDGTMSRWLTLDDEDGTNIPVSGGGQGSGFVVSDNGFILTNKHVASAWKSTYDKLDALPTGLSYPWDGKTAYSEACGNATEFSLQDGSKAAVAYREWVPTSGYVFEPRGARPIGNGARSFLPRNDVLTVTFPGSKLPVAATLVRDSSDSDVALIKIEAPGVLQKVELAADDKIVVGDRAFVLGYPSISQSTAVASISTERGQMKTTVTKIPEPTITEGIISLVAPKQTMTGDTVVASSFGDTFQLAINTTGSGNSGGPVFNREGKVIGLYTYSRRSGNASVSFAVPVKYGRDLLQPQRSR